MLCLTPPPPPPPPLASYPPPRLLTLLSLAPRYLVAAHSTCRTSRGETKNPETTTTKKAEALESAGGGPVEGPCGGSTEEQKRRRPDPAGGETEIRYIDQIQARRFLESGIYSNYGFVVASTCLELYIHPKLFLDSVVFEWSRSAPCHPDKTEQRMHLSE